MITPAETRDGPLHRRHLHRLRGKPHGRGLSNISHEQFRLGVEQVHMFRLEGDPGQLTKGRGTELEGRILAQSPSGNAPVRELVRVATRGNATRTLTQSETPGLPRITAPWHLDCRADDRSRTMVERFAWWRMSPICNTRLQMLRRLLHYRSQDSGSQPGWPQTPR